MPPYIGLKTHHSSSMNANELMNLNFPLVKSKSRNQTVVKFKQKITDVTYTANFSSQSQKSCRLRGVYIEVQLAPALSKKIFQRPAPSCAVGHPNSQQGASRPGHPRRRCSRELGELTALGSVRNKDEGTAWLLLAVSLFVLFI